MNFAVQRPLRRLAIIPDAGGTDVKVVFHERGSDPVVG